MPAFSSNLFATMESPAEASGSEMNAVRQQAALVRSLLDELEVLTHPGSSGRLATAIAAQTIEELAQLACKMMTAASTLAAQCASEVHLATWPDSERTPAVDSSQVPPITRQH